MKDSESKSEKPWVDGVRFVDIQMTPGPGARRFWKLHAATFADEKPEEPIVESEG